ncbi:MAG: hypothetical protein AMS18_02370 [Gemmatimonas sp. SG8_17]|nr:MAG: hypothetical protein AMS18_02370 [Gemmatimonas sp. SG8_17]
MHVGRVLREDVVVGLVGAAAVAAWFLVIDLLAGRPFFTPAILGQALLFGGVADAAMVVVAFPAVIGYTMVHVLAFVSVATVAAFFACQIERWPSTLFVAVVLFTVFEFGFDDDVATMAQPLLGALAWANVAIGNAFAAFGAGYYLWRAHPRLRQCLGEHPLGTFTD